MNIEEFREYCLAKPGVTEETPFGDEVLVYKVMGKIFALAPIEEFKQINLKCDPDCAVDLREKYEFVQPGYHMSKKHWNTIIIDGRIGNRQLASWIDDSYNLVVHGLSKKIKSELNKMGDIR